MKGIQTLLLAGALLANTTATMTDIYTYNYKTQIDGYLNNYVYVKERTSGVKDYHELNRIYNTSSVTGQTTQSLKLVNTTTRQDGITVWNQQIYVIVRLLDTNNRGYSTDYQFYSIFDDIPTENLSNWSVYRSNITSYEEPTQQMEDCLTTLTTSNNTADIDAALDDNDSNYWLTDFTHILYRYSDGGQNNNSEKNQLNQRIKMVIGNDNIYTLSPNAYIAIQINLSYYGTNSGYTIPTYTEGMYNTLPVSLTRSTNYTIEVSNTTEIVDIPGIMFTILGMPFAWMSMAFNLTIFPGTPYAINISHLFFALVGSLILIYIIKKLIR